MLRVDCCSRSAMRVLFCCAVAVAGFGTRAFVPDDARAAADYVEVSEGSTTSPEFPVSYTIALSGPEGELRVRITRGGTVVAEAASTEGYAEMAQVPQVGDVVSLEAPFGTTVLTRTYDGRPTMDPTVCAGSSNFSGQRSPDASVSGGYYTLGSGSYGSGFGSAHITSLSGSLFAGSFPAALAIGETVYAGQKAEQSTGGTEVTYFSRNTRPVGVCPGPGSSGGSGVAVSSGGVASSRGSSGAPPSLASGLPAPVLARTANIALVSGKVTVRLPGASKYVPLTSVTQIPFGAVIEATHGTVSITTAGPHGGTQTAKYSGGRFVLTQGPNGLVVATLAGGDFSVCRRGGKAASAAKASPRRASGKHVVRKLWANAHGRFSTKGNYAAGAVQGTEWLTEDLCEGTFIRVTRDRVAVTDLVRHRNISLRAGHSYLANARRVRR